MPEQIVFPWINRPVSVYEVDEDEAQDTRALATISTWTDGLRVKLERACWADYLDKVYMLEAEPPDVPVITEPGQVWEHIVLHSVRPQGADYVVVYAEPAWDDSLHHEWVIQAPDQLHYVGQYLKYSVTDDDRERGKGYFRCGADENRALNYEELIAEHSHIPRQWPVN
jgi:hypothetical protein